MKGHSCHIQVYQEESRHPKSKRSGSSKVIPMSRVMIGIPVILRLLNKQPSLKRNNSSPLRTFDLLVFLQPFIHHLIHSNNASHTPMPCGTKYSTWSSSLITTVPYTLYCLLLYSIIPDKQLCWIMLRLDGWWCTCYSRPDPHCHCATHYIWPTGLLQNIQQTMASDNSEVGYVAVCSIYSIWSSLPWGPSLCTTH